MSIVVNLDVMLAKRKLKLKELSEKVGVSTVNLSILKQGKVVRRNLNGNILHCIPTSNHMTFVYHISMKNTEYHIKYK